MVSESLTESRELASNDGKARTVGSWSIGAALPLLETLDDAERICEG